MRKNVYTYLRVDRYINPITKELVKEESADEDWEHVEVDIEACAWFYKEGRQYIVEDEEDIEFSSEVSAAEKDILIQKLYDEAN